MIILCLLYLKKKKKKFLCFIQGVNLEQGHSRIQFGMDLSRTRGLRFSPTGTGKSPKPGRLYNLSGPPAALS